MDITVREQGATSGSASSAANSNTGPDNGQRLMDRAELIERLAQSMRLKSGLDLPHAYFVEQVKLKLAGSPAFDQSLVEPDDPAAKRSAHFKSAACFEAWAMRD